MSGRTLEELLLAVKVRGLRLNGLAQLSDLSWQANVTNGVEFWEFGRGPTPHIAIAEALFKSATEPGVPGLPNTATPGAWTPERQREARAATVKAEDLGL